MTPIEELILRRLELREFREENKEPLAQYLQDWERGDYSDTYSKILNEFHEKEMRLLERIRELEDEIHYERWS